MGMKPGQRLIRVIMSFPALASGKHRFTLSLLGSGIIRKPCSGEMPPSGYLSREQGAVKKALSIYTSVNFIQLFVMMPLSTWLKPELYLVKAIF